MQPKRTPVPRSEEHTRALLSVLDIQAPPDFQAVLLAQACQRLQPGALEPGSREACGHPRPRSPVTCVPESLAG